jgi:uncharacterized protein with von Willebrand factor type A (vWA) domain
MKNEIKYFASHFGAKIVGVDDVLCWGFADESNTYLHTAITNKKIDENTHVQLLTDTFTLDELQELLKPFL